MNRFLSLALAAALTLALLPAAVLAAPAEAEYLDWDSVRQKEAVSMLTDLKLISGYDDGAFQPVRPVTRAEAAKLIAGLLTDDEIPADTVCRYADAAESWAGPYIEYCAEQGVFSGPVGSDFRPSDGVTVRELAKMLLAVLGHGTDAYTGTDWASAVDADAERSGLYDGDSDPDKDRAATREEACLLINNALKAPVVEGYDDEGSPVYELDDMMEPKSLVQLRFGASAVTGVLQANAKADLRPNGGSLGGSCVHLSGYVKDFRVPLDAALDEHLLGHRVTMYAKLGAEGNEAITAPAVDPDECFYRAVGTEALKGIISAAELNLSAEVAVYQDYAPAGLDALSALTDEDTVKLFDYEGDSLIDLILIDRAGALPA